MGRRILTFLSALLLTLSLALIVSPEPANALGKFIESDVVGVMQVDPILYHNMPMTGHRHLFLGSTALLEHPNPESATYDDLVGNGTLLDNPDDTAAYWVPDLVYVDSGQSVEFRKYFAYYRGWNHQNTGSKDTIAYPPDMRLITGDARGIDTGPINKNNWSCDERSSRPGPFRTIEEARCDLATGTVFLTLHLTFPSCWNGILEPKNVTGDTQDTKNLRFPKNGACPVGFPIKLPELRETIKWDYQGDGTDVALTSDLMQRHMGNDVESGQTLHGDFWNTWVQTGGVHNGLEGMVQSCIRANNPAAWCND